jgi:hypothetical protein
MTPKSVTLELWRRSYRLEGIAHGSAGDFVEDLPAAPSGAGHSRLRWPIVFAVASLAPIMCVN